MCELVMKRVVGELGRGSARRQLIPARGQRIKVLNIPAYNLSLQNVCVHGGKGGGRCASPHIWLHSGHVHLACRVNDIIIRIFSDFTRIDSSEHIAKNFAAYVQCGLPS